MTGALIQTGALFLDAYREINARKLFWITLAISAFVVLAFAAIGLTDRGITFLWWTFPHDYLNAKQFSPALLYKFIFSIFAIPIWLAWAATILALISTASIIPDFIAGGSVELTLSKPIGRSRLILTKFATALLFAALQVGVFTLACFLVIGVRGHEWEPRLFLAIPIMILFFSYLYCVCMLLGLLTRSTIAALMLTILFWLLIAGINGTETVFLTLKVNNELREQKILGQIESNKAKLARNEEEAAKLGDSPEDTRKAGPLRLAHDATLSLLGQKEKQLVDNRDSAVWITRGHDISYAAKTVLPKTAETVKLLDRWLLKPEDLDKIRQRDDSQGMNLGGDDIRVSQTAMEKKVEEAMRSRTVGWVVGTSIAFELVVLLIGTRIFVRRDF